MILLGSITSAVRENEPALKPDPGDGGNRAYDFVFCCNSDTKIVFILLPNVPSVVLSYVYIYNKDFINFS